MLKQSLKMIYYHHYRMRKLSSLEAIIIGKHLYKLSYVKTIIIGKDHLYKLSCGNYHHWKLSLLEKIIFTNYHTWKLSSLETIIIGKDQTIIGNHHHWKRSSVEVIIGNYRWKPSGIITALVYKLEVVPLIQLNNNQQSSYLQIHLSEFLSTTTTHHGLLRNRT